MKLRAVRVREKEPGGGLALSRALFFERCVLNDADGINFRW